MSMALLAFLAFLPILVAMFLLVGLGWGARQSMPVGYVVVVIIGLAVWKMKLIDVIAATIEGLWIAATLLWIIFGALLLLATLKHSGAIATIRAGFIKVSPDRRIQAIILGFLFGCFIEGSSGFGTPAAVVGPLLLALGFPAFAAVIVGMVTQSTPVTFGAVGTPVLVGVGGGLTGSDAVMAHAQSLGMDFTQYLHSIGARAANFHTIIGFVMPLIIAMMLTWIFGKNRSWREGLEVWPFALFAGIVFVVPYVILANTLGPEFPSMISGLLGVGITSYAASKGFLQPKKIWDFDDESKWDPSWFGTVSGDPGEIRANMPLIKAWTPYVLVGIVLLLTRLTGLKGILTAITIDHNNILGTSISHSWQWVFSPGCMIGLVAVITWFLHQMKGEEIKAALKEAAGQLYGASMALIFTVPMVRVFIRSGLNDIGLDSMPILLAKFVADTAGNAWPAFAAVIGALGAMIAGSNTVSNMTFGLFQWTVADLLGISQRIVVAVQAVGGAAGNMICVHNAVAAAAVVGLIGKEGLILRKTFLPTIYYLVAVGVYAMLAIYVFGLS
ncbi:MAG: L-lactate permease [Clostridia bacterium]|nr:L-lactate permease [Clostridia bacterium]